MHCKKCKKIFLSEELCDLVPKGSKFGYDVLNFIGRSLFLESRDEKQIQDILKEHNIPISMRQIGYLGKKFIIYLTLAHKESQEKIKKLMISNGGYILHIDGTCEGSSPHLMVALDSLSEIVIDSVKLPSENSKQIIPFLENIKTIYGTPVAAVHDMGSGILRAIKEVFPKTSDFICHYHFLKDIGNDLFGTEYVIIRKTLAKNSTRPKLKKILKKLIKEIDTDKTLEKSRDLYLQQQLKGKICNDLPGEISSYLWIHWIFDYKKELDGYGFPFDRDHYVFYQRLAAVKRAIEILPHQIQVNHSINQLDRILNLILDDQELKKTITLFKEKITIFDQLREAMEIALPEGKNGLNDDGENVAIKTIKEKVTAFRNAKKIKKLAETNEGYKKMLKQIDKYWDKLLADPITVCNLKGKKIIIQPQRTNNILERLFRTIKRGFRKKSGNKSLNRTLKALLSKTPLVQNLQNPKYMKALLNGNSSLEELFSKINVEDVRKELKEINEEQEKISISMKKVLQSKNFPLNIAKVTT